MVAVDVAVAVVAAAAADVVLLLLLLLLSPLLLLLLLLRASLGLAAERTRGTQMGRGGVKGSLAMDRSNPVLVVVAVTNDATNDATDDATTHAVMSCKWPETRRP